MSQEMESEIAEFTALVQQHGVHAALAYLNQRTPHRYTGLFRFEGEVLRNELLVDGNQPQVQQGADVPMAVTFCSLVGQRQAAPVVIGIVVALGAIGRGHGCQRHGRALGRVQHELLT